MASWDRSAPEGIKTREFHSKTALDFMECIVAHTRPRSPLGVAGSLRRPRTDLVVACGCGGIGGRAGFKM